MEEKGKKEKQVKKEEINVLKNTVSFFREFKPLTRIPLEEQMNNIKLKMSDFQHLSEIYSYNNNKNNNKNKRKEE